MTDERMALAELLEKRSDSDLLREMVGFVAKRLMDLDVDGLVGAGHGERDRDWHTRSGTIPLRIPKLRRGSYFPGLLEPRRSSEKALAAVAKAWAALVGTAAAMVGMAAMAGTSTQTKPQETQ